MHNHRDKFMSEALDIAVSNATGSGGGPFGALVVKDGKVISVAGNTVTPDKDPTAHAEVNAIRKACKVLNTFDLSGCELYTSCEPCPMCLSAAYWAKVDKIVYSADREDAAKAGFSDAFIYDQFSLPLQERRLPMERRLESKGNEPFAKWEENENKVRY